jgi:lipopolysaccharide export system protein LptA
MKKFAVILALVAALGLYISVIGADSYALGKMKLSGDLIEVDGQNVTAKGNPSLTSNYSAGTMKAGTMRVDSLKADTIQLDLTKGADKKQALKGAVATGSVVIKGKRAEENVDESGKKTVTIQDVNATAQSAVLVQDKQEVVLTGNVVVKVTEPGVAEPVWALNGKKVTLFLKDNRMLVEGQPDNQAEITVTPKEEKAK